mgnify:CR=1 FL=1
MFDNFEIWWVTGAQLLYGGDAVVAVDGHSKEMVEGLNKSGNIPVKIVYKGTANSSNEVEAVMKAANNDNKCILVLHSTAILLSQTSKKKSIYFFVRIILFYFVFQAIDTLAGINTRAYFHIRHSGILRFEVSLFPKVHPRK